MENPIKTIRKKLGISQTEMAILINEKQPNVARWEKGSGITWKKVMDICEMLKFEKKDLFT